MTAQERQAIDRATENLEKARKAFRSDRGAEIIADVMHEYIRSALADLRALAAEQPSARPDALDQATSLALTVKNAERQRALDILRSLRPDSPLVEEMDSAAFREGFKHCRAKAIAIIERGAENYDPDQALDLPAAKTGGAVGSIAE
jgi:hypothetical protein